MLSSLVLPAFLWAGSAAAGMSTLEAETFCAASNSTLFPNSTAYETQRINVWDKRSNLNPACIYMPSSANDVAKAVEIFHTCNAPFAVKGGGHMTCPGANTINDGVLLALNKLSGLKVNENDNNIEVGPGNRWVDVYQALEPYGQYTIGGRLKTIGVPGLSLIGGVSYFLNKYGYTMDNVLSYDVVLGNGTQVVANATSNPDLFWALKGGAGNYGIVTKFVLKTYNIPLVSTTFQKFNMSAIPAFIKASCDMVLSENGGTVGAGAVININYNITTKEATPQVFGMQETTESPPSMFANFTAIPAVSRVHNVTAPVNFHSQFESPNQMFR
ncbi:FAD binding domain-containing protein [Ilyonectria robusta]